MPTHWQTALSVRNDLLEMTTFREKRLKEIMDDHLVVASCAVRLLYVFPGEHHFPPGDEP